MSYFNFSSVLEDAISAYIITRLPPLASLSPFLKGSERKQNLSEQFQIYFRYYTLSRYITFLGKFSSEQKMFEIALFGTRVDSPATTPSS